MSEIYNIGIFGVRNVGKSTLMNALVGQEISIVSNHPGTTTDPIQKRVEIHGLGICNFIDTAGYDDVGELGIKRSQATQKITEKVDLAILMIRDSIYSTEDESFINQLQRAEIPIIVLHNFSDISPLSSSISSKYRSKIGEPPIEISLASNLSKETIELSVEKVIDKIAEKIKATANEEIATILQGVVKESDTVVLVCPIDNEAPKGRLILPQVMAIRDILDHNATAVVLQPNQISSYFSHVCSLDNTMVITDSQVFKEVANAIPKGVPLCSFSILMSRLKGSFKEYLAALPTLDHLKDGDDVLILESCSHRATCNDIGRVKIPKLLEKYCGKSLNFHFISGSDTIPDHTFSVAIQCGGCMTTKTELNHRVKTLGSRGIPVTNYGMAIAYMSGLFDNENFKIFMQRL